ncbi:formamidopyrimidine-DNA glycosylase-like isoform X1 [Chenopodium quinoa]|uniref:formamidopyrimidine-DNA glycosylase-like isoform X1 n=1 Tax=Chenopodium quinoa TaxID=63459 RepID=UPI000B77F728|nr:formamidopyrimidine-DNA glycosylase-like isoform X1 [Chenopodium quinoa]
MPELPEVEAARSAVAEHCIGKKIVKSIIADDSKVINGVSRSDFEAALLNKTIVAVHRKGKNMWLQLDSPPFPSFQFGMAGAVYIKGVAITKYKRSAVNDADEWPSKYSKFFIELNDGLEISFTDKRRFATVRLLDNPASVPPISALGPDALLEPMTEGEFIKSLSKKKIAIKPLLLDQSFISGIGNWVADEVLYQARIHPSQNASSLSKEEGAILLKSIKEVLEKAVEVGADSSQYPSNWIFHSREKKPGKAFVDGKKIDFITVRGRTSAYVPELQKLTGVQATEAPAKPRKQASKKNKDESDDDDDANDDNGDGREDEVENMKFKQMKNSKSGKQPPRRKKSIKNDDDDVDSGDDDDDESDGKTKGTRDDSATAKRKPQGMNESQDANKSKRSRGGGKKATAESKSRESIDSDGSDDDVHENIDKKPTKAGTKKPQKQTKRKAK